MNIGGQTWIVKVKPYFLTYMFLVLVFVSGCKKETVYEGIYEGMKHRQRVINPSNEPIPQEQQSYDAYQREREEYLKKNNEVNNFGEKIFN